MKISDIQKKVSPIMAQYGVRSASVFGSFARDADTPDSDIDLLVTLGDRPMGMISYVRFLEELERSLGRKVDVVTNDTGAFLRPYIGDAKVIYEG